MMTNTEFIKREKLFKLMKENPDLPIVPVVDYEVVGEETAYWQGALGESRVGEYVSNIDGRFHLRDDEEMSEAYELVEKKHGYETVEKLSEEAVLKAYADLPWRKAIIVEIDLPE